MRKRIISLMLVLNLLLSIMPLAAHADSGMIDLWVVNSLKTVYKTSTIPANPDKNISLVSAKNEYESDIISVRNDVPFDISRVDFSDMVSPKGIIAGSNLSYHFVEYALKDTVKKNAIYPEREGNLIYPESDMPDPLSNEESITVAANTTQPIFITNYVPSGTPPGIYNGEVSVKTTLGDYIVPIQVEVANVEIPKTSEANFINYQWTMTNGFMADGFKFDGKSEPGFDVGKFYYGLETYSDEWFDLMDTFAKSMADYRQNMIWVRTDLFLNETGTDLSEFKTGIPDDIDWSLFDRYVQTFIDRGITDFANIHLIKTLINMPESEKATASWNTALPDELPETDAFLTNYLTALNEHLQEKGWIGNEFTWYQHISDEPITDNQRNYWTYVAREVKEIVPSFKTMDADPNGILMANGTKPYVDVWVPLTPAYQDKKAQYKAEQAAGKDVWVYTCEVNTPPWLNRFWTQPTLTGRLLFWNLSQDGVQGALHWGWNAWYVGPWGGDSSIVYPDTDHMGVKSSIRYEAQRDGIEDYELMFKIKQTNPALAKRIADSAVNPDDPRKYTLDPAYIKTLHDYMVKAAAGENVGEISTVISPYKGQDIPMTFMADNTNSDLKFTGNWFDKSRQYAFQDSVKSTVNANDAVEYQFNGTGIDLVVEKNDGAGKMAVYLDQLEPVIIDAYEKVQHDYFTIYSHRNLPKGQHTIKVVNLESKNLYIDAFRVQMYDGQILYDASLESLDITNVPNFNFNNKITNYQIMIPSTVNSVSITPKLIDKDGTLKVNGTSIDAAQMITANIPIGKSKVRIQSTASDGTTTKEYTLNFLKGNVNEVGANVARNISSITASAARPGNDYSPEKMVDGSYGSMFASMRGYNDNHPFPHEFILSWDEPQAFNTVVMATMSGLLQGINDMDIEVSKDGVTWESISQHVPVVWKSNKDDGVMEHTHANIPAVDGVMKLRIQINDAYYTTWSMYALYELELYNLPDHGDIDDLIFTRDVQLTGLGITDTNSGEPIDFSFDPSVNNYTLNLGMDTDKIAITPTLKNNIGGLTFNDVSVTPNQTVMATIPEGKSTLTVEVIGDKGAFKVYKIAIKRIDNLASKGSSITLDKPMQGLTDASYLIDDNYETTVTNGVYETVPEFQFPHTYTITWDQPQTFNTMDLIVPGGSIDHKPTNLVITAKKGDTWVQLIQADQGWEENGETLFWPVYEGIGTEKLGTYHVQKLPIVAQTDITEMQFKIYGGRFYENPAYYVMNELEVSNVSIGGQIAIEVVNNNNPHLIQANAGANGSISPSGTVEVNDGSAQTFTLTPNSGYLIDTVTVDNENAAVSSNEYTFSNVTSNHTISVTFKLQGGSNNGNNGNISSGGNSNNNSSGGDTAVPSDTHVVKPQDFNSTAANGTVTIQVKGVIKQIKLPINTSELLGKNQLVIQMDKLSIILTPEMIKQLTDQVSASDLKNSIITLETGRLSEAEVNAWLAKQQVNAQTKIKLYGEVFDFSLFIVTKDGKKLKITNFDKPIVIKMKVDQIANPNSTGIYYLSDNEGLKYVGGQYLNGEMIAEIHHLSKYAVLEVKKVFTDVPSSHWALGAIEALTSKQIVNGESVTTFGPERHVTRAEFTSMLVRSLKLSATITQKFSDVASDAWYANDIAIAFHAGIVTGKSETTFEPAAPIMREEMVTMLMRAYVTSKGTKLQGGTASVFTDEVDVSKWAIESVRAAAERHFIEGRNMNKFVPRGLATRAESAMILLRILQ